MLVLCITGKHLKKILFLFPLFLYKNEYTFLLVTISRHLYRFYYTWILGHLYLTFPFNKINVMGECKIIFPNEFWTQSILACTKKHGNSCT